MKGLKNIRKKQRVTQEGLAFLLGVSKNTIYSYEAGKREPSIEALRRLSVILNCTVDELIKEEDFTEIKVTE